MSLAITGKQGMMEEASMVFCDIGKERRVEQGRFSVQLASNLIQRCCTFSIGSCCLSWRSCPARQAKGKGQGTKAHC